MRPHELQSSQSHRAGSRLAGGEPGSIVVGLYKPQVSIAIGKSRARHPAPPAHGGDADVAELRAGRPVSTGVAPRPGSPTRSDHPPIAPPWCILC